MKLLCPASAVPFLHIALGFFVLGLTGCSAHRHDTMPVAQYHASSISPQQPSRKQPDAAQSTSKSQLPKRTGPIVFLDPGHGGRDCGAMVKTKHLQEKTLALDVVKRVERLLHGWNYNVLLSRRSDVFIPLQKRVAMAQHDKAEIFVSVHFNSASSRLSSGAEIYYFNVPQNQRSSDSKRLASCILRRLCESIPSKHRGVKHGDFCVIRETTMPAVLVEAAFITNTQEAKLLASAHYKQKIATAIAKGVHDYFHS